MIAIAVWIVTRSNYFLSLIPILAGVTVLVHGLVDLRQAILLRQAREGNWWLTLVIAFLAICLAFVMLTNPFETIVAIMRFIGIILVAVGISDVFVLTQGAGVVPQPGKSRKASSLPQRKAKSSQAGSRSSRKRKPVKTAPSRKSVPSEDDLSQEPEDFTSFTESPQQDRDEEEASAKPAKKSTAKPKKSGSLLGHKLKSLTKSQGKAEKASRMSKLERVLGSTSDEISEPVTQDEPDTPRASQQDPDDFKISKETLSSPNEYDDSLDDDDDFWDDEEWDKL